MRITLQTSDNTMLFSLKTSSLNPIKNGFRFITECADFLGKVIFFGLDCGVVVILMHYSAKRFKNLGTFNAVSTRRTVWKIFLLNDVPE